MSDSKYTTNNLKLHSFYFCFAPHTTVSISFCISHLSLDEPTEHQSIYNFTLSVRVCVCVCVASTFFVASVIFFFSLFFLLVSFVVKQAKRQYLDSFCYSQQNFPSEFFSRVLLLYVLDTKCTENLLFFIFWILSLLKHNGQ